MTLAEAYEDFLRSVRKFSTAQIDVEDYAHLYRRGESKFITDKYRQFENTQEIVDLLSPIIVADFEVQLNEEKKFTLPEDYLHVLLLTAYITLSSTDARCKTDDEEDRKQIIGIKRITADAKGMILRNVYMKPNEERWYYQQAKNEITLLYEGDFTIDQILFTYLSKPRKVTPEDIENDSESIWSDLAMLEINNFAVTAHLEADKDQRIATYPSLNRS